MRYVSYKIKDMNEVLYNKSAGIDDSELKALNHIAHELLRGLSISYPFIYRLPSQEFLLLRLNGDLLYLIIFKENPYLYLASEIANVGKDDITLSKAKLSSSILNTLASEDFTTLECIIEAIIENIANDKIIYLSPKIPTSIIILIFSLIPRRYLEHLDISYDYNTKIRFSADYNKELYFSLKASMNNTVIEPKRYSYTIVDNLRISLKSAMEYRDKIDRLIDEKKIDISAICDLLNLIDGKIERINSIEKLSLAIRALAGMEYNGSYIGTIIFTNINKYKIDYNILFVYKFIYENVESSHSYIIRSFRDNIRLFIDVDKYDELELIKALDSIAPFPLVAYIDYLNEANSLDKEINNSTSFKYSYLLLELICRWIKKAELTIAPNKYLSLYLKKYIASSDYELRLVISRIRALNNKGLEILLNNEVIRILRSPKMLHSLSLDRIIFILEELNIIDATHYLKKLSIIIDRYTLLDRLLRLEEENKSFYDRLIKELNSDTTGRELIASLNERSLIKNTNISLLELQKYYNKYYLDRHHNDNGSLINAIMGYLNKCDDINKAIDIYKDFYQRLDISYKDTLGSIKRLNDFILSHYDLIYSEPYKYIEILDDMNSRLNRGRLIANSYYSLLKIALELQAKRYNIFDNVILYKSFIGCPNELRVMYKYFYELILEGYFSYISNKEINEGLANSFNLAIAPFLELDGGIDRLIKYIGNNEGYIFYFLLITASSNIKQYKRILDKLLKSLGRRELKHYLDDYITYLRAGDIKDVLANGAILYLSDFIEINMNRLSKLILRLKHK